MTTDVAKERKYSKKTKSLCPICFKVIDARVFEKGGKILMEKECAKHGDFQDIYWSDAEQFKRFLRYQISGDPIDNPNTESNENCPFDCGLCGKHQTHTMLANIDVTNRCNQRCPICFANSAVSGYLYEPSLEQIKKMLKMLREQEPTPVSVVQFSGGEPTVHPKIIDIIKMTKEMGFNVIMMATNGIKIAKDFDFAKQMKEAGLRSVYLQFDGVTPEPYIQARGYNALPIKQKAVENLVKLRVATVLVPTVVKGVNDDQLGGIIDYAFDNILSVKAVNFQPVAFTGRIEKSELERRRITITDIMRLVEEQTDGKIMKEDWLPISAIAPLEMLFEKMFNKKFSKSSTHTHCGAGLYLFEKDGTYIPLNRFMDLEKARRIILEEIENWSDACKDNKLKDIKSKTTVLLKLAKTVDKSKAPEYFDWKKLLKTVVFNRVGGLSETLKQKGMFIGCMHFMDPYNFDVERVQRCCIHYATPDGRAIPFCTYNTLHRDAVEKKHSVRFQKTLGT
jgi:uncharacterized radical SAM superfamily Fe-S cluster-containing enzyme